MRVSSPGRDRRCRASAASNAPASCGASRSTCCSIDRQNYHLFTPLLYQVASCLLEPGRDRRAAAEGVPRRRATCTFRHGLTSLDVDLDARRRAPSPTAPTSTYDSPRPRCGQPHELLRQRRARAARARPQGPRRSAAAAQPRARLPRTGRRRRSTRTNVAGCSRSASSAAVRPASNTRVRSPNSCGSCLPHGVSRALAHGRAHRLARRRRSAACRLSASGSPRTRCASSSRRGVDVRLNALVATATDKVRPDARRRSRSRPRR